MIACSYLFINSIDWDFNWIAVWQSANIKVSATFSMSKLLHNASSHNAFNLSNAYYYLWVKLKFYFSQMERWIFIWTSHNEEYIIMYSHILKIWDFLKIFEGLSLYMVF